MVRLRPGVLPGLGVSAPISNVSATEWNVARSDINVLAALLFDPAHPNYGAIPNDPSAAAVNTVAINLAASDAKAAGGTLVIKGTYYVDDTINVQCHMDGSLGYLITENAAISPVMQIGDPAEGGWIASLNVTVPRLRQANKSTTPGVWNAADIGLSFVNLNACHITTQRITDFSLGVLLHASGTGLVYNDILFGWMENNKVNFHAKVVRPGPGYTGPYGGWLQENVFINGRFHHNGSQGTNVPGVAHIILDDLVGANKFIKPSIEGNTAEWHIDCGGMYNQFDGARFESAPPRVRFRASSNSNVIMYGYGAMGIDLTDLGANNHTYDRNRLVINGGGDGVITAKSGGNSNGVFVVLPPSGGNPTTDYGASIGYTYSRFKGTGDVFPRLQINNVTGAMAFGTGSAAPTATIGPYGATGIGFTGEFLSLGATRVGFHGATPTTKPAITGSRGGNGALASLLAALAAKGLITDSTTA